MIELFVAALFLVQAAPQAAAQRASTPIVISRAEADQHLIGADALYLRVKWNSREPLEARCSIRARRRSGGAGILHASIAGRVGRT